MLRANIAARFDRRILIEQNTPTTNDTTGAEQENWTTVATVWAERMFKSSSEQFEANQQVGVQVYDYKIRHPLEAFTVDQTMRITDQTTSETLYVRGISNMKREGYMMLTVEKRDNH